MAHKIEEYDVQEGVEMAWHGLTKVRPVITFDDCWLAQWDAQPVELLRKDKDGVLIDSGFRVLQCNDNGLQIGFPFDPNTYSVLNNRDFLKMVQKGIAGTGHKIVSIGSLQNRNKTFISISLEGLKKHKVAGREFDNFLNLGNGLADRSPIWGNTSGFCTVCANTYAMNLAHKGKNLNIRIRHSKNMQAEIENMPQIIDAAIGVQAEFAAAFNSLSKVPASLIQAERVFTGFLTDEKDVTKAKTMGKAARQTDVLSTRSKNTAIRLTELFSRGAGNKGKDFADVFSAATDYFTHESSGGNDKRKQFESSEFGSGLRKKQEFFELITVAENREKLEERGAKVLELPIVD